MKFYTLLFSIILSLKIFGQDARLVLDSAYLVFDPLPTNETYLVIENSDPNAITIIDDSYIVSENELNKIRWNHSNGGTYTIPFATNFNVYIPISISLPPSGSGSLVYSTYNYGSVTPSWNNFLYMPSDVTHMNSYFSSLNNSNNVIDRFWIIDPNDSSIWSYSNSGNIGINFTYDLNEITPGNIITSSSPLSAQRFNSSVNQWGDYLPNSNWASTNVVTSLPILEMYRSWTLSSQMFPLPVELIGFMYECSGNETILRWVVGSENNVSHYVINKSLDGQDWAFVDQISGMGNYQGEINYSLQDESGNYYYRLIGVDIDGSQEDLSTIYAFCQGEDIQIISGYSNNGSIGVIVRSTDESNYKLRIIDGSGRCISDKEVEVRRGLTDLIGWRGDLSSGVYSINLYNDTRSLFVKIFNPY